MRILGQVEGKRRDDARAWKLPMPLPLPSRSVRTVLQNVGYLRIPSVLACTSGVPERDIGRASTENLA